jgi:hypothetical protein
MDISKITGFIKDNFRTRSSLFTLKVTPNCHYARKEMFDLSKLDEYGSQ